MSERRHWDQKYILGKTQLFKNKNVPKEAHRYKVLKVREAVHIEKSQSYGHFPYLPYPPPPTPDYGHSKGFFWKSPERRLKNV